MYRLGRYSQEDNMSNLVSENYPLLLVMSRFGIALGFGDKTIKEVCEDNNVDTDTFLTVVNTLLDEDGDHSRNDISIESLIGYLQKSHSYFLDFRLPGIRTELEDVLTVGDNKLNTAILNYFDEYVAEVRKHMMYEEQHLFPYIKKLIDGHREAGYSVAAFSKQHDNVEERLIEFKNIIIKYYPAQSTNQINSVLFDIFSCEKDLASHNAIEDKLLVPAITELERKNV